MPSGSRGDRSRSDVQIRLRQLDGELRGLGVGHGMRETDLRAQDVCLRHATGGVAPFRRPGDALGDGPLLLVDPEPPMCAPQRPVGALHRQVDVQHGRVDAARHGARLLAGRRGGQLALARERDALGDLEDAVLGVGDVEVLGHVPRLPRQHRIVPRPRLGGAVLGRLGTPPRDVDLRIGLAGHGEHVVEPERLGGRTRGDGEAAEQDRRYDRRQDRAGTASDTRDGRHGDRSLPGW